LSGFTTALEAARDQLTAAAGIFPDMTGLPGAIGRAVLSTCCPAAAPGSAPARSNAPPPATSTTATSGPTPPQRSPQSASPCAHHHREPAPAHADRSL